VIDKFDESLRKLRPNYIIVLGDRFEIFGVAIVSHLLRIPIVHIHGGELTEGAIDDAFRHSITKMSSLHFVANESSKNRVIQLGEDPRLIHVVGGLGVDAIKRMKIMPKTEVEKALKFELGSRNMLVTFHPSTTDEISPLAQLNELLAALKELKETSIVFTSPNRDRQVEGFDEAIASFVKFHPNTIFRHSLGNELYISCLAQMDVIVGNSSSGLTEAPSLGVPTLNIGSRQQGRDKAKSVFDCHPDKSSILESLDEIYALRQRSADHQDSLTYGVGGATSKIMTILRNLDERSFTLKKFFDIPLT
jgi:GDP/UDP-N,N'-diacetylbacillosamine 2-epimerase (hydrolysing)